MEKLNINDFETLEYCPWDGVSRDFEHLYYDELNCAVVKCKKCGVVFARNRLNKLGLDKYWSDYLTRVHINDDDMLKKRQAMYELDFEMINNLAKFKGEGKKVLDVGCGNGAFLSVFKNNGYQVHGVEFGEEAASVAKKDYDIYYGEFPKIEIEHTFDLIVFRGVLQYLPYPKQYLEKALSLLNEDGYIFITAQPNIESFCFKLFLEKFKLPVNYVDFIGYSEKIFTEYFQEKNFIKIAERYFYEETPYANIQEDILKVAAAINVKKEGQDISFKAPSFWGNMVSLVYEKY